MLLYSNILKPIQGKELIARTMIISEEKAENMRVVIICVR
jgi:hypothetical protein